MTNFFSAGELRRRLLSLHVVSVAGSAATAASTFGVAEAACVAVVASLVPSSYFPCLWPEHGPMRIHPISQMRG